VRSFVSVLHVSHAPSAVSTPDSLRPSGGIAGVYSGNRMDYHSRCDCRRRCCESPSLDLDGYFASCVESDSGLLRYTSDYAKPFEDIPISGDLRSPGGSRDRWNRRHLPCDTSHRFDPRNLACMRRATKRPKLCRYFRCESGSSGWSCGVGEDLQKIHHGFGIWC